MGHLLSEGYLDAPRLKGSPDYQEETRSPSKEPQLSFQPPASSLSSRVRETILDVPASQAHHRVSDPDSNSDQLSSVCLGPS